MNMDGQRFGKLTVIRTTDMRADDKRHSILYECRCDCGNTAYATGSDLRKGGVQSCGCLRNPQIKPGDRFYRLEVLRRLPDRKTAGGQSKVSYECLCDCGKKIAVDAQALKRGSAKSCGCLSRDKVQLLYRDGTAPCKLKESEKPRSTNTSGITGVWWDKQKELWCGEIVFQNRKIFLGRYRNKYDAEDARLEAEDYYFKSYLDEIADENHRGENHKNNKSGIVGVFLDNGKWLVSIYHDKKQRYIGSYETSEEATRVRKAALLAKKRGIFQEWYDKYRETGEIKVRRTKKTEE